MDFLELVKKRGSCRRYSSRRVCREVIENCLRASQLAPSACNSQPWNFIIIHDESLKNKLADGIFSGIHSMNAFAKKAPVLIAVVREKSLYAARLAGQLRGTQYSLVDLGIACEHFVLQAAQEGLGTCWIGWFNEKYLKKVLGLPKDKKVDIVISLGYPEGEVSTGKKRKPLSEISEFR